MFSAVRNHAVAVDRNHSRKRVYFVFTCRRVVIAHEERAPLQIVLVEVADEHVEVNLVR